MRARVGVRRLAKDSVVTGAGHTPGQKPKDHEPLPRADTRKRYSRAVLESGWHLVPRSLCYVMLYQTQRSTQRSTRARVPGSQEEQGRVLERRVKRRENAGANARGREKRRKSRKENPSPGVERAHHYTTMINVEPARLECEAETESTVYGCTRGGRWRREEPQC